MANFNRADPNLAGTMFPARIEANVFDVEVEGTIPSEIRGTFYRVSPEPHVTPRPDHTFIDGDGLVSAFCFEDGEVNFRSRWVETPRFKHERAAKRSLFGLYRNPYTDDPSVAGVDRTVANTSIVAHHGKIFAAKEDGLPYELSPDTLETRGRYDYAGKVSSRTHTAHTKFDPRTGDLLFYGSAAKGEATPDVAYYIADKEGRITHETWFHAPYGSLMHDFAITRNWTIFPVMPAVNDLTRIKNGGPIYRWEPERGSYIGVMPRRGTGSEIRWFRAEAMWAFHVVNAWEEGNKVYIDLMESDILPFPFPNSQGIPIDPSKAVPRLTRWTIDLESNSDTMTRTRLHDYFAEMPIMDFRHALTKNRFSYMGVDDPRKPLAHQQVEKLFAYNSIGVWDNNRQDYELWYTGEYSAAQEPAFVPRGPDANEGDGYLMSVVNRLNENRADLVILDTANIAAGPVVIVKLPFRQRAALHGCWVGASHNS
jgi:carotenoid cleavage dioxygenase-like enzyme